MISRRDIAIGLVAMAVTLCAVAAADQVKELIGPSVYDWNKTPVTKAAIGGVRQFFRGPTKTLEELEVHVTTLNAGEASHPPHKHPNEELVIVKEGTVEALVHGQWERLGAGSVIFNASNECHGLRNVGSGPATYHVINWKSERAPK